MVPPTFWGFDVVLTSMVSCGQSERSVSEKQRVLEIEERVGVHMVYIFTIQNMSMSNLQSCCSTLLFLCCTSRIFWSSLVRQHHFQKEVLSVPWYHKCATMTRCKQLKWQTQHHKSWPTDSHNLASEPHIKNSCHLGSSFQIWWEVRRVWSNPLINHHN